MPLDLHHRTLTNTALPYITNCSVTDSRPRFVSGSNNCMTSLKGFVERRPAWGAYGATTQIATGRIKRIFGWQKWAGAFYVMLSVIDPTTTFSKVYKQKIGTDADFVELTAAADTGTAEAYDYATSNNYVFFGNGTSMWKYDGTTVTRWGITGPTAAVSTALGGTGLSPTTGYKYQIAWLNNTTGHTSSPSPYMAAYVKPVNQTVTISGNTTSDTQVTHVRIYRTADGGTTYFEHPASPIVYATWVSSGYADSTADTALLTQTAPALDQNDQPPALKGITWYAGRLWGFAGMRVYYSGFEEIPVGTTDMPEEAFPPDNYYAFGQEVTGLAVAGAETKNTVDANQGGILMVFCSGSIHSIQGDSITNFRRGTIVSAGRGCRARTAIAVSDGMVAWLDSSNTVQISDGITIKELSRDIRPDIAIIAHGAASMAFHGTGIYRWLLLADGETGVDKCHVYDLDLEQWMPPWTGQNIKALAQVETAAGTFRLLAGINGLVHNLTTSTYHDGVAPGNPFAAVAVLGLIDIVEDKPSESGSVLHVGLESNAVAATTVSVLTDEDPVDGVAGFVSLSAITGNPVVPHARTAGTSLIENHYKTESGPIARRASVKINWAAANSNFKTYSIDIAYRMVR